MFVKTVVFQGFYPCIDKFLSPSYDYWHTFSIPSCKEKQQSSKLLYSSIKRSQNKPFFLHYHMFFNSFKILFWRRRKISADLSSISLTFINVAKIFHIRKKVNMFESWMCIEETPLFILHKKRVWLIVGIYYSKSPSVHILHILAGTKYQCVFRIQNALRHVSKDLHIFLQNRF